jgi:hypothetical protein
MEVHCPSSCACFTSSRSALVASRVRNPSMTWVSWCNAGGQLGELAWALDNSLGELVHRDSWPMREARGYGENLVSPCSRRSVSLSQCER